MQISAGVFAADQPKCAEMFALAVRAWVEVMPHTATSHPCASVAQQINALLAQVVATKKTAFVRQITMMCSEEVRIRCPRAHRSSPNLTPGPMLMCRRLLPSLPH